MPRKQFIWLNWFPWKFIVSRLARRRGFVDPVKLFIRLGAFSQPMHFEKPLELIRAGMRFHARGLLNTAAIQHNLDWIWPFWVERQYNPLDDAFIPRSFSLSHINLTHRNWTAVGLPDCDLLPIVDPRGLLTPFWDSWSLDVWIVSEDGPSLFPSKLPSVEQFLEIAPRPSVITRCQTTGMQLVTKIEAQWDKEGPTCVLAIRASSQKRSWLVVSLRPYNPEGVSFVGAVALAAGRSGWKVNNRDDLYFDPPAERHQFCYYQHGDVYRHLFAEPSAKPSESSVTCKVGMATGAALFGIDAGSRRQVKVVVPLAGKSSRLEKSGIQVSWKDALQGCLKAGLPDERFQRLFDIAIRMLVLHSPGEVYPGPFTYKRFWFRDAAFILHALCCVGLCDRVERALDRYPERQTSTGFFRSQEGEWDANGEALWTIERFCELSGRPPRQSWLPAIERGAKWIVRKRLSEDSPDLHAGLLPAGLSAEHLGPNDYYFWDNFWGIAGLRAAADLLERCGDKQAERFRDIARRFMETVAQCLAKVQRRNNHGGMPASVYRRMDSGAVGSLAAGYPLQLFSPRDHRLLDTTGFLMDHCIIRDAFFLDIIHSGINPYLTLHIAQVLMRAGEMPQFMELFKAVAKQASPTGQWPEAIHPRTLGGCMGDGNHTWAAAEWVMMVRNSFVREEADRLIIGSGLFPEWLRPGRETCFGPAPTSFGMVTVRTQASVDGVLVSWDPAWRRTTPTVEVRLPGFVPVISGADQTAVLLPLQEGA